METLVLFQSCERLLLESIVDYRTLLLIRQIICDTGYILALYEVR